MRMCKDAHAQHAHVRKMYMCMCRDAHAQNAHVCARVHVHVHVRGHEHVCNYMCMVHGTWYMVQEHVHVNADVRVHAQVHYNNMYMRMHM